MSTREALQTRLDAYLEAERAVLKSQEYVIGQGATARRLRRADLSEIRAEIKSIRAEINQLDATARHTRRVNYLRPWG